MEKTMANEIIEVLGKFYGDREFTASVLYESKRIESYKYTMLAAVIGVRNKLGRERSAITNVDLKKALAKVMDASEVDKMTSILVNADLIIIDHVGGYNIIKFHSNLRTMEQVWEARNEVGAFSVVI
jgi:hypothetical protein